MRKIRHFKTNTLLKNLIGKDLINDDNIGVIELVKNAYDASSPNTIIKFNYLNTDLTSSELIIADHGSGMSESDINDKWLNVAYSEKKAIKQNEGAYLAGNKGVGRFSCDRLGEKLDIFTRVKGGQLLHLSIDWNNFEIEGKKDLTIQEIDVFLNTVDDSFVLECCGLNIGDSGTILLISKLRSHWSRDKLLELKRHLQKFINPNQLFSKNEFKIELIAEEYLELDKEENQKGKMVANGEIKNLIFENLKFKSTYIESVTIDGGKNIRTTLFHDGNKVYWIEEKNKYYNFVKKVSTTIYFLNAYKKSYFKRQTGIRSIDFGSIFLFLNGFRVAPYGDRGNDWLKLDIRQGQGKSRYFGSRDLVGRIEINDDDDFFEPISSREGLKENDAFSYIKEYFFYETLRRLEKFVVEGLSWDSVPEEIRKTIKDNLDWDKTREQYSESNEKKKRRFSLGILSLIGLSKKNLSKFWFNTEYLAELADEKSEEIKKIIQDISNFDGDIVDDSFRINLDKITSLIKDKERKLQEAATEVLKLKENITENEETLSLLELDLEDKKEVISSLESQNETIQAQSLFLKSITSQDAKSLLNYHHQICNDAATIENYIGRAVRALKNDGNIKQALKFLEKISKSNKKIVATAQYATKANFKSGTKKEMTDITNYFEQYLNNVASEFSASGLQVSILNKVSSPFEMPIKRIELSILIDNLVSNASKAEANKMNITMHLLSENVLEISFSDDGKGLSNEVDKENIFDFGVTTTNGSGLGLYHAKEFMNSIHSDIEVNASLNNGLEIRMEFRK
ncbi:sensor histidine kinase [Pseudoalteromonas sp. 1_2015MBL_MicDiv]|uniref:sensor histidine kinase n=1 Tax=Pseudoalteromonas sp. 1_2015MBL_MicDiv TaxID=1720343 RepID=UPI000BBE2F98|nr:ATP-binding protein [Pseudoalteromonas sp. 1_2015MBL_MicDiv]ATG79442.1 hypothetical protein AOR04_17945 [Pseudoalteromonas sp. 1_2015MBL_MicDiv]